VSLVSLRGLNGLHPTIKSFAPTYTATVPAPEPEPPGLTREEIRRIVLDLLG